MANDLSANPLKVDSVMGSGAGLGRELKVTHVVWSGLGTTAITLTVVEPTSGKTIYTRSIPAIAAGHDDVTEDFAVPLRWRDFKVTVIGGGVLYIYHE